MIGAAILLSTLATGAVPTVSSEGSFSCEVRDGAGATYKLIGNVTDWRKHDANFSGRVFVAAPGTMIPSGSYLAVARNWQISLSNYLENAKNPTRIILANDLAQRGAILIERKDGNEESANSAWYAGFCEGSFAEIYGARS